MPDFNYQYAPSTWSTDPCLHLSIPPSPHPFVRLSNRTMGTNHFICQACGLLLVLPQSSRTVAREFRLALQYFILEQTSNLSFFSLFFWGSQSCHHSVCCCCLFPFVLSTVSGNEFNNLKQQKAQKKKPNIISKNMIILDIIIIIIIIILFIINHVAVHLHRCRTWHKSCTCRWALNKKCENVSQTICKRFDWATAPTRGRGRGRTGAVETANMVYGISGRGTADALHI